MWDSRPEGAATAASKGTDPGRQAADRREAAERSATSGVLRVTETFLSLQGEGPELGRPSVFLRLGGCSLRCVWCDTWYTWRGADGTPGGEWRLRPAAEVAGELRALGGGTCQRLVITGGEPLLQQRVLADHLLPALAGWDVEFETAGHVMPLPELLADPRVRFDVSPKLPGSGNPREAAERPEVLAALNACPRASFKYVIAGEDDWAEMLAHVERWGLERSRVGAMPEGVDDDTLLARLRWLAPRCIAAGIRLLPRLHIHTFGNRRGT